MKMLQVKLFSMCSDTLLLYGNLLAVIAPHRQSASFRGQAGALMEAGASPINMRMASGPASQLLPGEKAPLMEHC